MKLGKHFIEVTLNDFKLAATLPANRLVISMIS